MPRVRNPIIFLGISVLDSNSRALRLRSFSAVTQLRTQGWMHHLARHAVACFLTRGDLWQSWEKGAATFDRLLVDADFFVNNGNWMWLSASQFFFQYFRVYSPIAFAKKYDKEGAYVKHFLPALRKMPAKCARARPPPSLSPT